MKFVHKKYVLYISAFIFLAFVSAVQTQAQTAKASELNLPSNLWANAGITGAWRINYAESDNTVLKMQTLLQKQLAESAEAKKTETKPTISISLFPPETLVLVNENENQLTINEGFANVVLTRTVFTNGKTLIGNIEGESFYISANKTKDSLKVETISPTGNRMTETYKISEDGKKMLETLRIEDGANKEIITLKRVYDRTILDVFDGFSNEIN